MSVIVMFVSILAASGSLAYAYASGGLDQVSRWLLVAGAIWLFCEWRRWRWAGSLVLLVFVAAAAYGLWVSLSASLMLIGAVGGLLGWDLSAFQRRMRLASPHDDLRLIEARHLGRVSIVAAASLIIAGVAAFVRIRIPFEAAVVLALLGAIGLTRLAVWIQRENDL